MVELIERVLDVMATHPQQVHGLGEILTQQPVGILVEAALPPVIRVRKVHLGLQALGNERMFGKLLAVIQGQRQAVLLVPSNSTMAWLTSRDSRKLSSRA